MNENNAEEKLLANPLAVPELNSGVLERPRLTAEEFINSTPEHELKNIFGDAEKEIEKPKIPAIPVEPKTEKIAPVTKDFLKPLPYVAPKESVKPKNEGEKIATPKPDRTILAFFVSFLLLFFIIFVALYIWGGILKEKGITPETEIFVI